MPTDDLENRVNELEKKFAVATTIGLLFAALIGASGVLYIPAKLKELVDHSAAGKEVAEIETRLQQARADSEQVAKIAENGTIRVGEKCFKPRILLSCVAKNDGNNHQAFIDNCSGDRNPESGTERSILAQCN